MRQLFINSTTDEPTLGVAPTTNGPTISNLLLTSFLSAVILSTIIGNVLALLAVRKINSARSLSHYYIGWLAVCDLLIAVPIMIPMMFYTIDYRPSFIPLAVVRASCNVWQLLDATLNTVSLYTLCAVGLDRWLNIEKPLLVFTRNRTTNKRAILLAWLVPLIVWGLTYALLYVKHSEEEGNVCSSLWSRAGVLFTTGILAFYLPTIFLFVMFIRVAYVVRRHFGFIKAHGTCGQLKIEHTLINGGNGSNSNNGSIGSLGRNRSVATLGDFSALRRGSTIPPVVMPQRITRRNTQSWDIAQPLTKKLAVQSQSNLQRNITSHHPQMYRKVATFYHMNEPVIATSGGDLPVNKAPSSRRSSDAVFSLGGGTDSKKSSLTNGNMGIMTHLTVQSTTNSRVRHASFDPSTYEEESEPDSEVVSPLPSPSMFTRNVTSPSSLSDKMMPRQNRVAALQRPSRLDRPSIERAHSLRQSLASITSTVVDVFNSDGIRSEWRATKAIATVSAVLLLCWMPFLVLWPIRLFYPQSIDQSTYLTAIWCNYFSSAINPWLYTILTPRAMNALKMYLPKSWRKGQRCQASSTLTKTVYNQQVQLPQHQQLLQHQQTMSCKRLLQGGPALVKTTKSVVSNGSSNKSSR